MTACMSRLSSLETREPHEAAHIAEMIDILRRKIARDYIAGRCRRSGTNATAATFFESMRV